MKKKALILGVIVVVGFIAGSVYWTMRHVSAPFITQSRDPDLEKIIIPEGFSIAYITQEVKGARSLALSPQNIVYVGTRDEGKVYAVVLDANYTGEMFVVAENLNAPNGVSWHEGDLYVAEINRIIVFEGIDERFKEQPNYLVIRDDFPKESHHGWKYLRVGPDKKLYVPFGAPCNNCVSKNPLFASLTRMNMDGSNHEIIAHGVRNTVGFDWHPETGELWFTDNGRDWLGDDSPGDELNKVTTIGAHYGFPYCHNADILDPDLGKGKNCGMYTKPQQVLGPHVAALGMRFYTGDSFPSEYDNSVFIAEHGSWNRSDPIGYRVMNVTFDAVGNPNYRVFAEGWLRDGNVYGRPVDVLVLPDGSLVVSDDHAGALYRIFYTR